MNKEIHSYFQATRPIRYRIWILKIWLRETFCKHDYQLHIYEHSKSLIHTEHDEIRQCWGNKVWGTDRDIRVSCAKCRKIIVEEKSLGYKIDREWRKKADKYIIERRKAIVDLEPRHAKMRKEALQQMRSVETEIRWKVKERLKK